MTGALDGLSPLRAITADHVVDGTGGLESSNLSGLVLAGVMARLLLDRWQGRTHPVPLPSAAPAPAAGHLYNSLGRRR